jgi:DNA-directed RNA polymerase subunit E'/Rpb7
MESSIFHRGILNKKIVLNPTEIGRNLKQILESKLISAISGKCIVEGYVCPNTIQILSFSAGMVGRTGIEFQTVFQCNLCYPIEGMLLVCVIQEITRAGIHAKVIIENNIVWLIFQSLDEPSNKLRY